MQNCYGNKAGRPSQDEQEEQNERLAGRHIETLAFLQEIAKENKELKAKVETLERLEKMQNCYGNKAGRPSQDEQEEQNERLAGRHIETLAFLQEIAKENKELKAKVETLEVMHLIEEKLTVEQEYQDKVKQLQQQVEQLQRENAQLQSQLSTYQQEDSSKAKRVQSLEEEVMLRKEHQDEQERTLSDLSEQYDKNRALFDALAQEKEEMANTIAQLRDQLRKLEQQSSAQQAGFKEFVALKREFNTLKQEYEVLAMREKMRQVSLPSLKEPSSKLRALTAKSAQSEPALLNETLGHVDELRLDNSRLREENNNLLLELQAYREFQGKNEILAEELREVNQKNKELKFRIAKLEKEIVSSEQDQEEAETAHMSNARLQKRVQSLEEEVMLRKEHQDEQERSLSDLSEQYDKNRALFDALAQEKEEMANTIAQLRDQLRQLEQQSSAQQAGFKEFVALKREFNTLKQEYEVLAMREKMRQVSLPSLKEPSSKLRALTAKSAQSEPALVKIDTGKRHKKHKALTHLSSFTEGGQR
uniref:Uncharacterized protein n=1 Tax=Branchiostoma floridae TaxID=7739 RepID=C3ZBI0_BRAFL|eukprot:XP_002594206.1 hypothetical protein BRAFLDRAFT_65055 [Branchiostoma floridae]